MGRDYHYKGGSYYMIDQRSGFATRAEKMKREWDGLIVRDQSWEPRQPQDLVRGIRDDQTVPTPLPRQVDTFIGPLGTTLTANVAAGQQILFVQSSIRMEIGDTIQVMLDSGSYFLSPIVDIISAQEIQVNTLPYSASSGNVVIDISAYAQPDLYLPGTPA